MRLIVIAATVLLGVNMPVRASETAHVLWESWQASASERGMRLDAEAMEADGDLLTLRDVSLVSEDGNRTSVGQIFLSEAGDGSVDVTVPESVPVTFDAPDGPDNAAKAIFSLTSRDLVLRVEDPSAPVRFDVSLAEAVLELEEVEGGFPDDARAIRMALAGGTGQVSTPAEAPADIAIRLAEASFDISQTEPETGQPVTISNRAQDIDVTLVETAPPGGETEADLTITASTGAFENVTESPVPSGRTIRVQTTQDAMELMIKAAPDRLTYETQSRNAAVSIGGSGVPIGPVATRIAEAELVLDLPVAPDDAAQFAEGRLSLRDVAADEALWTAFDPAGALPRDTLQIDASLKAEVMVTEEALAMTGSPADSYPRSVEIETLEIRYGETSLSASGEMSLAPSGAGDATSPPRPEGTITIDARGILKLLQQLTAAGLVPPEQAMGAQMMIGMFAEQGEGDHLRSTIEAGADGSLRINGMQIR